MSGDRLVARLRSRLAARHHDANPNGSLGYRPRDPALTLRAAAVLVPLVEREDGVTVLLTQRAAHLSSHAGQVSFPGGRIEPEDETPVGAALREAEEEVGLTSDRVSIIGRLDTRVTGTNFAITPIIGIVSPPFSLRPNPDEVAAIFEVPIASFSDLKNYRQEPYHYEGRSGFFHVLAHEVHYIWGATAAILRELAVMMSPDKSEAAPAE